MAYKYVRILLVGLFALLAAQFIPHLYMQVFERNSDGQRLEYSPILKTFLIEDRVYTKRGEDPQSTWHDRQGKTYSDAEAEALLPISAWLHAEDPEPLTIDGQIITTTAYRASEESFQVLLSSDTDDCGLRPLYDMQRDAQGQFNAPADLARLTPDGIVFLDVATNTVLPEKSARVTAALQKAGFVFPVKHRFGLARCTTPEEARWWLVDSRDQVVCLRLLGGQPQVQALVLPEGFRTRHVACTQFSLAKQTEALFFGEGDRLGLLARGATQLTPVILDPADARALRESGDFTVNSQMFFRSIEMAGRSRLLIFDQNWRQIDACTADDLRNKIPDYVKVAAVIFPFKDYFEFGTTWSHWYWAGRKTAASILGETWMYWLPINLLFAGLLAILIHRNHRRLKDPFNLLDLLIVSATGLFGFIGALLVPNRSGAIPPAPVVEKTNTYEPGQMLTSAPIKIKSFALKIGHLFYKEWVKMRWAAWGTLCLGLGLVIYVFLNVRHDRAAEGFVSHLSQQLFMQGYSPLEKLPFYDILKFFPLLTAVAIGFSQYLPEILDKRIKLTLHLPHTGTRLLYQMVLSGAGVLVAIFLACLLLFWGFSVQNFPMEVTLASLSSIVAWMIGAITVYLFIATIAMEPVWKFKVLYALLFSTLVPLFTGGERMGDYRGIIPVLLGLAVASTITMLFSAYRFSKGEK